MELQKEIRNFIGWELASQDTIDFKKCYVDLCDDLISGLLLSQIVYWHLPSKDNGKTKLRVQKEGHMWVAKGRNDWYEEIRITAKQYDRAIKILEKCGLVETKTFKFNANPTKHVRLKWEMFLEALNDLINGKNDVEPYSPMVIDEKGITILTFGEQGNLPLGNNDVDLSGISLTETTNKEQHTKTTGKEYLEKEKTTKQNNINIDDDKEPVQINDFAFIEFCEYFQENHADIFDKNMFSMIYDQMKIKGLGIITIHEAIDQYKRIEKIGRENVSHYPSYFVQGIILNRTSQTSALKKREVKKEIERLAAVKAAKEKEENSKPFPFYNWLEN